MSNGRPSPILFGMNRLSAVLCCSFLAALPTLRGQDWAAVLDVDGPVTSWSVVAPSPAVVVADSGDFHMGGSSVQLRLSAGAHKASLDAKVSVPGTLTFWWKLEGEATKAGATFTAEGVELSRGGGKKAVFLSALTATRSHGTCQEPRNVKSAGSASMR
jgi:hypothetical protein